MRRQLFGLLVLLGGVMLPGVVVRAQEQGGDNENMRAQFAGMQRVSGEVTAVAGSTLTIKGADGTVYQVVTTDNTRVMKAHGVTEKIADVKVGDGVMAMGNLDAPKKTIHAAMLGVQDAAELKKMKENLGKTYIMGKVTAIDLDNAKMTVERPDKVAQTIGFDETTSFKRGHLGGRGGFGAGGDTTSTPTATSESITLADVKVGDQVGGQGSLKGGVFVPTQLTVATPGQGRRHAAEGAAPAGGPPAATTGAGPGH